MNGDGIKGQLVYINQLLRSCSSMGANAHEAKYAQSPADFLNKFGIGLKACYKTEYWIDVLFCVCALDNITDKSAASKCGTIGES